ncbi:MAG: hypothetical protein JO041_09515 [Acidobacteria bacterium]|nr:hypothetical protein [Acidobacteriota bacterium]
MNRQLARYRGTLLSLCLLLAPVAGFAQGDAAMASQKVTPQILSNAVPSSGSAAVKGLGPSGRGGTIAAAATNGVAGIDSLQNWTGQFFAEGFDPAGNPQSVWPYAMVGNQPETNSTATINAPIVPVTIELLNPSGHVAHDPTTGALLRLTVTDEIRDAVVHSPMFEAVQFNSGTGQFGDEMQRAAFWNRIDHSADSDTAGWHTLLSPSVKRERTMAIPFGYGYYALDANGRCCAFMLIDENTFINLLYPPTYPVDNSTPIGAAELAGDITTHDLSMLLFNNVYLYAGTLNQCCVLGFHAYDIEPGVPQNGNLPRLYVGGYASWISPGLFGGGFEDITALAHELAETINDPFIINATPWWLSRDPRTGAANCSDVLEVGDVVEVLSNNTVYPIAHNNRTYHPQNVALFPWFAFDHHSPAPLRAYSFPDETTLRSLSPEGLKPGCQ